MYTAIKPPYKGFPNETRVYSPITLNREWPTLGRLVFMVLSACVGTIINGFFVAAFFVEHNLRRLGYVFQACLGFADMMITSAVMPVAAVVLLSGIWDTEPVCQVLQVLTEASTYSYSLLFTLVAAESYYRLCRSAKTYDSFIAVKIGFLTIMVFVISITTAAVGTYLRLDYDYCQRSHFGDFYFRTSTSIAFHLIPGILTCYFFALASAEISSRCKTQMYYRRSQQYHRDNSSMNLNIAAFLLYVAAWMPYIIVIHNFPDIADNQYYHSAWIGLGRSLITSFLYCALNRTFRRAFSHLFYYCCCKSNRTRRLRRHRRGAHGRSGVREVRTHIMHQAINPNSPHRAASTSRETHEL